MRQIVLATVFAVILAGQPAPERWLDDPVFLRLVAQETQPAYPQAAREARIQGTVRLQVRVSANGIVQEIRNVTGPAMLQPAAIDAARRWRFRPYVVGGEPVSFGGQISIHFTL